jgi:phosphatidylserine/phosphatidylglycerophosphate/cardiolipin synthase-like enzyme
MARKYSSVYFSPKRGAAATLIGFLDRTKYTLDCAVYSITHEGIANALIRAHQRGVKVRVVTDKAQAGMSSAKDERLEAAGIEVRRDTKSGLMHAKYAVCDEGKSGKFAVAAGSFNWTANADENNVEHFQVLRLKATVAEFGAHFEQLWADNAPKS